MQRCHPRRRPASLAVLALLLAAAVGPAWAQGTVTLPSPVGRINDFANVLDPSAEATLDARLKAVEDRTTAEIAVATVPSLQGLTVEEYAERLFRTWGVGQAKVDNGVLVLVAPSDREMRIEVGYGLEGVLPDGLAGAIIRETFIPRFREDDYAGGIVDGVNRVAEIVERNHVLTAEERQAIEAAEDDRPPRWLMVPFFGIFIGVGAFMTGLGLASKTGFPLIFGGLFGGIPFLMSLVPFFNAPAWILLPWALLMAALGYRTGRRSPEMVKSLREGSGGGGASSSGWTMGGSSGSSSGGWSGGSSSSGGSSFGGGSSGGGGASGRW